VSARGSAQIGVAVVETVVLFLVIVGDTRILLGVVGGQMLFQGIESMFGQHAGSLLSGQSIQPALSETVVNNFYGDQPSSAEPSSDADAQDAEEDPSVADDDLEQDDSFGDGDNDPS